MLKDHKEAVALFRSQSKKGTSAVDNFATDTLPNLEHHLDMVQDLAGAAKSSHVKTASK